MKSWLKNAATRQIQKWVAAHSHDDSAHPSFTLIPSFEVAVDVAECEIAIESDGSGFHSKQAVLRRHQI